MYNEYITRIQMGLVSVSNNISWMVLIVAINFVLCLVAIVIVRFLAPFFVYITIIAFVIVGLASTSFLWYEYADRAPAESKFVPN